METNYTIAQISKESGFSVPTLRFYEQEGLIPPVPRDGAGNRRYGEAECSRVNTLRCLRAAGLTLPEMKRYIALVADGEETLRVRKEILLSTRTRLENQLAELRSCLNYLGMKLELYTRSIRALERGEKPPVMSSEQLNRCFSKKKEKTPRGRSGRTS